MACPTCGLSVLFGGVKNGGKKYCGKNCYEADEVNRYAGELPLEEVERVAQQIRNGACPKCNGEGPIDVHKSYSVYSILLYTSWATNRHVVCKQCARKKQGVDFAGSLLLGWWGFPFGLIVTPVMLLMNIVALFQSPGRNGPTKELLEASRKIISEEYQDRLRSQTDRSSEFV